ncbi:MAG: hypothetical protein LC102_05690 [Ignavibacteriales bacterium]|nr:MAG: hypothetical protein F9K26_09150 [Ignavibacteriaceae bacterium]MBW7874126.1 hypothetical protein [Ignavibacteria bacterium]MCZ2142901.1 hypothetical protein [Ignavibacteriales bacterium]OQY76392.1 MAG: hypothetical protein B6D45_03645 [Ignavibacteriales bacterium UTCHB3]MBZ0197934.1 hypothetical protein [Ignavibacteriaceae bacterium]
MINRVGNGGIVPRSEKQEATDKELLTTKAGADSFRQRATAQKQPLTTKQQKNKKNRITKE